MKKVFRCLSAQFLAVLIVFVLLPTEGMAVGCSFLAVDPMVVSTFGAHGFHDGMLAVQRKFAGDYMYLRENGEIITFDGAFGFDYCEGLVPVVNEEHKVGYADTNGKLVIPYQFDLYCSPGELKAGFFQNGRCPVFVKSRQLGDVNYDVPTGTMYGTWKTIDRTGAIVSEAYESQHIYSRSYGYFTDPEGKLKINNSGYTYYEDIMFEGKTYPKQAFSGDLGIFFYNEGLRNEMYIVRRNDNGISAPPTETAKIYPALPDILPADTYFQSTGKIIGVTLGDLDFGGMELSVTNDTDYSDSGIIGVVACNTKDGYAGVFFTAYKQQAHSKGTYVVEFRDIIDMGMFGDDVTIVHPTLNAAELDKFVKANVIQFVDKADLLSFYSSVPYEQNWVNYHYMCDFQPLCEGSVGTAWLKTNFGIIRSNRNGVDHSNCER